MMARSALEDCPPMTEYEAVYYAAFGDLSTERQIGMSIGPIPTSAIDLYSKRNELSRLQSDMLYLIIRAMDSAYLSAIRTKQAKSTAK